MKILGAVVVSYLLGSIPTAYLWGKIFRGIDIRQHGSGNVGATNAFRVLGRFPGVMVLMIDIVKGILALTWVGGMFSLTTLVPRLLCGFAVVAGHNWTVFLKFQGGKGMATSLGVLIGLTISFPALLPVLLICVGVWLAVFLPTGYVSLASLLAAVCLPVVMWLTKQETQMVLLGIVFCVLVIYRHKANIRRLLAHQEHRAPLPYLKNKESINI